MYDGYRQGGLDDETAEALCQVGAAARLGRLLGELDPRIHYRLNHYGWLHPFVPSGVRVIFMVPVPVTSLTVEWVV